MRSVDVDRMSFVSSGAKPMTVDQGLGWGATYEQLVGEVLGAVPPDASLAVQDAALKVAIGFESRAKTLLQSSLRLERRTKPE